METQKVYLELTDTDVDELQDGRIHVLKGRAYAWDSTYLGEISVEVKMA